MTMNQKLFISLALAFSTALGAVVDSPDVPASYKPWLVGAALFLATLSNGISGRKK